MNESWEPVSDEDDDDYCLAAQALEYDMWEGQFDLIATDSITDYSERSELSFWTPQEKLPKLLPREYNDFPDDVNESVEDIVSDLCDIKSDIKNISKILLQENILLIHTLI